MFKSYSNLAIAVVADHPDGTILANAEWKEAEWPDSAEAKDPEPTPGGWASSSLLSWVACSETIGAFGRS